MATLILTAVGTAVGGPIGGAIGALLGQSADARLFAPKTRGGPRLGELAVQSSSYGTDLPKIFGRMRVAGTVIWATDLQEHRSTSGGGKGRPSTTSYSYSASFAVALSARRIRSVGRIWADGKLLRGAGGDFKTRTDFRLYLGDEEQDADPLIASAEGIGSTPAYRGIAYAMFEDFELADYGNRIPSISVEVEAEAEPVPIGAIAETLAGNILVAGKTPGLIGYAASGDSVRGALEGLAQLVPLALRDEDGLLRLTIPSGAPVAISADEAGVHVGEAGGRTEVLRRSANAVPNEVSIAHYDPARDWQISLQRATAGGSDSKADRIALPAALDAQAARALAERRLAASRAARVGAKLHLGWRRSAVRPGVLLRIAGDPTVWKVERWSLQRMVLALDLVRAATGAVASGVGASAGRTLREPDLVHGGTVLRVLDIPVSLGGVDERPHLLIAAAGAAAGWRRAELRVSFDGGASWVGAGRTALPATMGSAATALPAGVPALLDLGNTVEVQLLNDALWLESRSNAALAGGANLALLGAELIQFGTVEPLGERRFRLSRLLRGRRGTEWAVGEHAAGESFVLVEAENLAKIEGTPSQLGTEVRVAAHGIGDGDEGVSATHALMGEALRPPSPVHLGARRRADGGITIHWVRRSRHGWSWIDGSDTALAEETELYQLRLSAAAATRSLTVAEPSYFHSAADQVGDGGGPLTIEIAQIGTFSSSRPATITVERP